MAAHRSNSSSRVQQKNAMFSSCVSCMLLLSSFYEPVSANVSFSGEKFHPGKILSVLSAYSDSSLSTSSSASSSSSSSSSPDPPSMLSESVKSPYGLPPAAVMGLDEVRLDEILQDLYEHGYRSGSQEYRKASMAFMINLFNRLQRGGKLSNGNRKGAVTDTVRSFSGRNLQSTRRGKSVINFNIPYLPAHERLRSAEVRFLRHPANNSTRQRYRFKVHIRKDGKVAGKFVVRERCETQGQYDVFDISKIVRPYITSARGNISVQIKVSKKLLRHTLIAEEENALISTSLIVMYLEDREFLKNMYTSFTSHDEAKRNDAHAHKKLSKRSVSAGEQYFLDDLEDAVDSSSKDTVESSKSRAKRDAKKKRRRRNRNGRKWFRSARREACQLYDFEVDFNAIGWGQWIIHPKRFNSKFCFGQCPSPIDPKYKPTNHAMLQTLMRMKRPHVAPLPCCVPSKLSAVSMLYLEYDEIVVRHHEDMVAEECGCR